MVTVTSQTLCDLLVLFYSVSLSYVCQFTWRDLMTITWQWNGINDIHRCHTHNTTGNNFSSHCPRSSPTGNLHTCDSDSSVSNPM